LFLAVVVLVFAVLFAPFAALSSFVMCFLCLLKSELGEKKFNKTHQSSELSQRKMKKQLYGFAQRMRSKRQNNKRDIIMKEKYIR
jgi:hypothetical protein